MEIRDTRNGDWHWVNNAVTACKHITHAEKCVYSALATFGGCKEIHPKFETIAKRANVTERYCKDAVRKLEKVGYLSIKTGGGRGNANVYSLLKMPKGCKLCTLSKGCKKKQKRVRNDAIKGDNFTPQLYKEEDKELNNTLSKDKAGIPAEYGNKDINKLITLLKKEAGLEKLDGAIRDNRYYCNLCIKKFSVSGVSDIICIAAKNEFWKNQITNFRVLYYNGIKILKAADKPSKPYYDGMPMKMRYGKWNVLDRGEWKIYADAESKIEWRKD